MDVPCSHGGHRLYWSHSVSFFLFKHLRLESQAPVWKAALVGGCWAGAGPRPGVIVEQGSHAGPLRMVLGSAAFVIELGAERGACPPAELEAAAALVDGDGCWGCRAAQALGVGDRRPGSGCWSALLPFSIHALSCESHPGSLPGVLVIRDCG